MAQYHRSHDKKVRRGTGGSKGKFRDKKLAHRGGFFTATRVSDREVREVVRVRGGNVKVKLKKAAFANVVMKDGKTKRVKIVRVLESHNPEFVRMNIITKGAVLESEVGKIRVTNRVGQDGVVNAVQL